MHRHPYLLIGSLLMLFSLAAIAAPKADLWEHWTAHNNKSTDKIDHDAWSKWLKRYVVTGKPAGKNRGVNLVRYSTVSAADRKSLADYLVSLQTVPISRYSRAEQKAYWINLYNATTVSVILDHYPVTSIKKINISPGILASGPWDRKLLVVEGKNMSLNDIEHRVLRPIWKDPLVHYGLNCASMGCPNLLPEAYTAKNTQKMLLANARAYVDSPRGARIEDGRLIASSLYDWYIADFGGSEDTVIAHLKSLANRDLVNQLSLVSKISKHEYDWSLNDAK